MTAMLVNGLETKASMFAAPCGACEVVRRAGEVLHVASGGRGVAARLAASCLVRPEVGDLVLTAAAEGEIWVLAVLRAAVPGAVRLEVAGDFSVAVSGTLSLRGEVVKTQAGHIAVEAKSGLMLMDELLHVGRKITAHVGQLRQFAEKLETVVGTALLRARQSLRFIEGQDVVRAQNIDQRADNVCSIHAESAFLTAELVMKLDADQIMMG